MAASPATAAGRRNPLRRLQPPPACSSRSGSGDLLSSPARVFAQSLALAAANASRAEIGRGAPVRERSATTSRVDDGDRRGEATMSAVPSSPLTGPTRAEPQAGRVRPLMPVPIGELAPPPADANAPAASERAEAILAAAEGKLLRALAETEGLALSRAELGDAVRGQLAAKIGLHLDPGVRDTLLGFARVLVPAIDRELSASAEVIDRALTRLVRDGRVGFAIHRLEARFWSLRPAVASAPAE